MIIGVDFDNTIVCYDQIYYKVALESGLIPSTVHPSKNGVRDYLRKIGKENSWTELQGLVYGPKILEAKPFPGVLEFFSNCKNKGITLIIISHKTKYPYLGEKYDLHQYAQKWLEKQGFYNKHQISPSIGLSREEVFFRVTKEEKIKLIEEKQCNYFIDDLPEIFSQEDFPKKVNCILFDPNDAHTNSGFKRVNSWEELIKKFDGPKQKESSYSSEFKENVINLFDEKPNSKEIQITNLIGGRNNKVFEVKIKNKGTFLVKAYFNHPHDLRNRLNNEFSFLDYALKTNIICVPKPFAKDDLNKIALYEYIIGEKITSEQINDDLINQATNFFVELNKNKGDKIAESLPLASEACFSIKEHLDTVSKRITKLKNMTAISDIEIDALKFVDKELDPQWKKINSEINKEISESSQDIDKRIEKEYWCINPSDFGFHNALINSEGKVYFIDFEYAGWDDPAKMICDFFCQPDLPVPKKYLGEFTEIIAKNLNQNNLSERVRLLLPLYQVKWCCILLNEFLNTGRLRREFAQEHIGNEEKKKRQLEKTKKYLNDIKTTGSLNTKMGEQINIINSLHKSTNRDYLARMNNDKVNCMNIAKLYEEDYWDGDRKYGYGGYKYMPGRWEPVAKQLIERYGLTNDSKILDVGCGKGYLLYEIKKILPGCQVVGFDISQHAIKNSKEEIKPNIKQIKAQEEYPFKDDYFDLVISITTLHNLLIYDLKKSLKEIERVGKRKYVVVESYRNSEELFNLECWALTAEAFFTPDEWIWLFDEFGYQGDYEFIYFEN